MQGLRSPWGLASPPARRCAAPVRELAPRGCVAYAGVALRPLGSLHRLPTLCRPFHGLIPQVMLGCRGCARPLGSLHRLPTLCRPFHGLIPRVMLGCRGFARPLGSLHHLPTLCRPFHGLIPQVMLGCRGCAPPVGLAPPPARRCAAPVRELAPRGCVAYAGVALARWARSTACLHCATRFTG